MRLRTAYAIALAIGAVPGRLVAQESDALYARVSALSGWELRRYSFDPGIGLKSMAQWNLPIALVVPVGRRVSLDLTSYLVSGSVETYSNTKETISGLTDTQLRLLYTLRRDRAVASVSLNLPTGQHSVSTSAFQVTGAVGSTFLSFPVSSFGTAFGVTGGLAYAQQAGSWNLGFSGSLRYLGSYQPFSGDSLSYNPGVELRARIGADRVLGNAARLLLGLTTSTFSTDQFTGTSSLLGGNYKPGLRFIGDAAYVRVIGRSTLTFAMWDFYRLAGDTSSAATPNSVGPNLESKENVFNAELRFAHPVTSRLQLEPMVGFRQWSPANYRGGRLYSAGLVARYGISDRFSAHASGRIDTGWIFAGGRGRADLTGTGFTLWVRYQR
jgi:hypothetical protein